MQELLARVLARLTGVAHPPLSVPEVADFGHFATPVALQLAKERKQNPMGIAAELAVSLMADEELRGVILNAEVAAPGFVNIRLTDEAHHRELANVLLEGPRAVQAHGTPKAIVEYASVNAAKPMHTGHLRNTALGASLARILEATGTEVVRWNYLGDWGTQFGKVVVGYKRWGSEERLGQDAIAELLSVYVRFHEEEKTDPSLGDEARETFRKLEQGDAEVRMLWEKFRTASIEAFEPQFVELGAAFDIWEGEASLEGDLAGVIAELKEKGLLEESDGAQVVRLDDENLPVALIQKSDGGSLYLTRDLAMLKKRLTQYPEHRILYVVANEQSLNFQQAFAIAKRLGWPVERAQHVKYGLILSSEGKKLSTREGGAVPAQAVLDEAKERVRKIESEREDKLSDESVARIAVGAVLYALLKDSRTSDIPFDWDRLLDFRGDSGPYLQYTHARLHSLVTKAGKHETESFATLTDPRELELIRHLDRYGEAVWDASHDLQTSHVALYLYQLASKANAYYQVVPILKDEDAERQKARVSLLEAVRQTLAAGMQLLGIAALDRV